MSLLETIKRIDDPRVLARSLGLKPSAVRNWIFNAYVPEKHHPRLIELAAAKGVKLTARDLDPFGQCR